MKMFCLYSKPLHEYLRVCGNDVSRLDARESAGDHMTYICSHLRSGGGWKKGLDGTVNDAPGEYLDEHAIMVNPNEFYEWHGGLRYLSLIDLTKLPPSTP